MNEPSSCSRCGELNPDDAAYCATCGAPLAAGHGLGAVAEEAAATSEQVDAPRFGETGPAVPPMAAPPPVDLPPVGPQSAPRMPTATFPVTAPAPGGAPVLASSKSTSVMIAVLAVAIVAILGGVFLLIASGPDDVAQTSDDVAQTSDDGTQTQADPSTSTLVTEPEASESPVITTAADGDAPEPVESTEPAASTIPDAGPTRALGDLGLDQPILDELCDGRYITFVGSAVGDLAYTEVVSTLLAEYPGTNYIWTKACPSLRQEFSDGSDIYGVVFGPYPTLGEACAAAGFGPADAYVRRISTTDPPDHTVDC